MQHEAVHSALTSTSIILALPPLPRLPGQSRGPAAEERLCGAATQPSGWETGRARVVLQAFQGSAVLMAGWCTCFVGLKPGADCTTAEGSRLSAFSFSKGSRPNHGLPCSTTTAAGERAVLQH